MELPPPGNRRVSINNPQETSGRVPTTSAGFPTQSSKISLKRSTYAYRPSMMSNRSSGGQSLLPSSILQKTSLNPPGSLQSKPSNVSSVHYADEEGKPLTDKNKDKDKGRGKGKGTGTRLLTVSGHGGGWAEDGRPGVGAGGALGTKKVSAVNPETSLI